MDPGAVIDEYLNTVKAANFGQAAGDGPDLQRALSAGGPIPDFVVGKGSDMDPFSLTGQGRSASDFGSGFSPAPNAAPQIISEKKKSEEDAAEKDKFTDLYSMG